MPKQTVLSKRAKERGMTEEELLADVFQRSGGSIDGAAKLLRAFPNSIRQELNKRGLEVSKTVKVELVKAEPQ